MAEQSGVWSRPPLSMSAGSAPKLEVGWTSEWSGPMHVRRPIAEYTWHA